MSMRVYLCFAACALLDKAARQGGSHRVALEQATDRVRKTQSNELL